MVSTQRRSLVCTMLNVSALSLWTNKFNRLAKSSTVGWKSHLWWAHAYAWNQPTVLVGGWQITWMFRISGPDSVDRVERRQPSAFANTVPMQTNNPSLWKKTSVVRIDPSSTRNSPGRKCVGCHVSEDCRATSDYGRGSFDGSRRPSSTSHVGYRRRTRSA